jgi:hypothetical protein
MDPDPDSRIRSIRLRIDHYFSGFTRGLFEMLLKRKVIFWRQFLEIFFKLVPINEINGSGSLPKIYESGSGAPPPPTKNADPANPRHCHKRTYAFLLFLNTGSYC